MRTRTIAGLVLLVLLAGPAAGVESILQNGTLTAWIGDQPDHWSVSQGAGTGSAPWSELARLEGGGLALVGEAQTASWRYLTQSFPVAPLSVVRLRALARAEGLRQDPGQFQSAYVGVVFHSREGALVARLVHDVTQSEWQPVELLAQAPAGAARCEVAIFLAMTGRLEVKQVEALRYAPPDSLELLMEEMGRSYSHLATSGADLEALERQFAPRAAEVCSAPEEFARVVQEALRPLDDMHIWLELPDGARLETASGKRAPAVDFRALASQLEDVRPMGRLGFTGHTPEGFGYVAVGSLLGPAEAHDRFRQAVQGLFEAPGIIIDLRGNTGGQEVHGQRLAGFFTAQPVVYALTRIRSGPEPEDLSEPQRRVLVPQEPHYDGPVVVLIGPGCVSSGEGMAMMFKALPSARLVGRNTYGASGNPAPTPLPNGVTVWFSRWVSLLPDGTPIEDVGVPPDVRVEPEEEEDAVFRAAVAELRRMTQAAPGRAR